MALEKLGGEAQQLRGSSALATSLALDVHLHGHLTGLLNDRLLASIGRYLSIGGLGVKELDHATKSV